MRFAARSACPSRLQQATRPAKPGFSRRQVASATLRQVRQREATHQLGFACRDSVIYAAHCDKLGGQVAVKVYSKDRTSASKLRAIKREAAMMVYLSKKRCVCSGGRGPRPATPAARAQSACSVDLALHAHTPAPPPTSPSFLLTVTDVDA